MFRAYNCVDTKTNGKIIGHFGSIYFTKIKICILFLGGKIMDIFCKIINNEISSHTIYEDDIVKVFLDINPSHTGHTLIVPKHHYQDLFDIDECTLNHILKIAREVSILLKKKLNYDGISLCENNGLCQEVKHFHLHLIPKYREEEKISIEEVYNKLIN